MMWWIYLISVAGSIRALSAVVLALSLSYAIGYFIFQEEPDSAPDFLKPKWPFAFLALSILVIAFVPSSKTLAAMYVLPKVAENQEIKTEAREVLDLAKEWLKKESR